MATVAASANRGRRLGAHVAAVDPIASRAARCDGYLRLAAASAPTRRAPLPRPFEQQADLGEVARGPRRSAGEDDVFHAGAAHRLRAGFTHHPANGLKHVGFAAAILPDHAGQARLDPQLGGFHEALEARKLDPLYLHGSAPRAALSSLSRRFGDGVPLPQFALPIAPVQKETRRAFQFILHEGDAADLHQRSAFESASRPARGGQAKLLQARRAHRQLASRCIARCWSICSRPCMSIWVTRFCRASFAGSRTARR